MLASAELVAFVPVTDLGRARAFYEGLLGLPCVDEDRFACVLDCAGTTLRATLVEGYTPARHTVVGWAVADLAAAVSFLADRGVTMERFPGIDQDDRGIWTTPGGDAVVWFRDPDGNILSLTEPARR
ncbi:MAG TPA: VOC family protein [Acidimicrobiia bacterium]|nr:VOC family protein [Acidimicrobiia bacterium]